MRSDRSKGRIGMEQYLRQMKLMLEEILVADTSVREHASFFLKNEIRYFWKEETYGLWRTN